MKAAKKECGSCGALGRDIPWALLIAAALISLTSLGSFWQESAAYLTVLGLILLAGSSVLNRLNPGQPKR